MIVATIPKRERRYPVRLLPSEHAMLLAIAEHHHIDRAQVLRMLVAREHRAIAEASANEPRRTS